MGQRSATSVAVAAMDEYYRRHGRVYNPNGNTNWDDINFCISEFVSSDRDRSEIFESIKELAPGYGERMTDPERID